ncbi:MAG: DUF4190 domain-containing protein [Nocardioides sp.]
MRNDPDPPSDPVPYGPPDHPGHAGHLGQYGAQASSSKATTSLVLGILSMLCLGFFAGIPAILVARSAMREIDDSHGAIGGRPIATAGLVTGTIGTVLSALLVGATMALFDLSGSL